jgi:hypothetical protein
MQYTWGWIPWKNGYGGLARAVKYTDGVVMRVGAGNTLYPISERLAKRFKVIGG